MIRRHGQLSSVCTLERAAFEAGSGALSGPPSGHRTQRGGYGATPGRATLLKGPMATPRRREEQQEESTSLPVTSGLQQNDDRGIEGD